jgi:hypothetical protein
VSGEHAVIVTILWDSFSKIWAVRTAPWSTASRSQALLQNDVVELGKYKQRKRGCGGQAKAADFEKDHGAAPAQ